MNKQLFFSKMLMLLTFTGLLSSWTSNLSAQTFSVVGNGTTSSGTNNWNPYHNGYWGHRSQFFVTAAQLTAAGIPTNTNINSLGFNIVQGGTGNPATLANFTVTVMTSSAANPISSGWLTSAPVAQSTPVNLSVASTGWNQTSLGAGFTWNGTDNLVIQTCYNNNSWAGMYARVEGSV